MIADCFLGILHPSSPDLLYSCHLLACNLSQRPYAHQLPMHRADVTVILDNIKFDTQGMAMQIGHRSDSFQNSRDGKGSRKNLALLIGVHDCPREWHIALGMFRLHFEITFPAFFSSPLVKYCLSLKCFMQENFKNIFRVYVVQPFCPQCSRKREVPQWDCNAIHLLKMFYIKLTIKSKIPCFASKLLNVWKSIWHFKEVVTDRTTLYLIFQRSFKKDQLFCQLHCGNPEQLCLFLWGYCWATHWGWLSWLESTGAPCWTQQGLNFTCSLVQSYWVGQARTYGFVPTWEQN